MPETDPQEPAEDVRRCARGDWCATATQVLGDDKKFHPLAAPVYRAFCDTDRDIIGDTILQLPGYYPRLAEALTDKPDAEVIVRVPFGPSVPLRLDVDTLMRVMAEAITSWYEAVTAQAGPVLSETYTRKTRTENLVYAARLGGPCNYLAAHLDTLLGLEPQEMARPDEWHINGRDHKGDEVPGPEVVLAAGDLRHVKLGGEHAGREMLRLDYMARAVLGEIDPKPIKLLCVPCKRCTKPTLDRAPVPQHPNDQEYWSQCRLCRHRMKPAEYIAWVKLVHAFAKRARTVPVLGSAPDTPAA